MSFGKLILTPPAGPRQEFSLAKGTVTIGRATNCDVALEDYRVSRNHTMLRCDEAGCVLVDLASTNGTQLNGVRVERAGLKPGDIITVGTHSLRFELDAPDGADDSTRKYTFEELRNEQQQVPLEVQLEETSTPSLTVHFSGRTWVVPLTGDAIAIGRRPENEVVIESEYVSRHHARVERKGNAFVVRDPGGNGVTLLDGRKINEHTLQPGATFRVGPALLTFKGGFQPDELTNGGSFSQHRPVVIVPGFGGSNLWLGSQQVWPNILKLSGNMDVLRMAEDGSTRVEARGLLDQVVVVPNLIEMEHYGRLTNYLSESLGYERGKDLLEFAYDFRRDLTSSARLLAAAIDAWKVKPPVTLICHSMGSLVGRYYIERLGGDKNVGRLLLLGAPNVGSPKTVTAMMLGPGLLPFGMLDQKLREAMATFPSAYQTLPSYSCVTDQAGRPVNLLEDDSWVPPERRRLLYNGRKFRRELKTTASVPTVCVFGYGLKTITKFSVDRDPQGFFRKVVSTVEPTGDDAVPVSDAILEGSEIHPVRQHHGLLYSDNDVKMRLKLELSR